MKAAVSDVAKKQSSSLSHTQPTQKKTTFDETVDNTKSSFSSSSSSSSTSSTSSSKRKRSDFDKDNTNNNQLNSFSNNQQSVTAYSGGLTSSENTAYVMAVLQDGRVPPLPTGCTNHIFISKDEKYQKDALLIATWLTQLGFSVWESQLEKEYGRGVTPDDMQRGVQNAAVVMLLLTPGIFHVDRHFVWNTEIKYALEVCHKPLMVVKISGFRSDKCNSTFATEVDMHHLECCQGTSPDFQPWIRAILRVPTRVTWKLSGVDKKREIMHEFRKIQDRNYKECSAFRSEITRQQAIQ
jgi:hypothetical protein